MTPNPSPAPRTVASVLVGVLAMVCAVVVPLLAAPAIASASTVGGAIGRPEIMSRAQNWVNRQITYTQTGTWASDADGGHTYRRDCSGLVSMAWHLGSSLVTNEFLDRARAGNGMEVIPRDQLMPGDAMVRDSDGYGPDGHMELFSHWVNSGNHSAGAYVYSFNSDGQTVQNPYANNNSGKLGRNDNSEMSTYTFIRYKKVDGERVSDFSGDGHSDVLGVNADGALLYYPNNGLAISPSTARPLGTNWDSFTHVTAGDFSGDGYADVLGVNADGNLMYYPNNGIAISPSTARQIGTGWGGFTHVMAADFSGDGHADILGVNADGALLYYPNNGLAISSSTARQLGTNWDSFTHVFAADFSGDGHADIFGVNAAGNLMYYPNNGLAISPSTARQIGIGWGDFTHVFASDFSGDDFADILGVNADGALLYYPNNGLAISSSRQLSSGFESFTHVL
jgi:hypothetical protein